MFFFFIHGSPERRIVNSILVIVEITTLTIISLVPVDKEVDSSKDVLDDLENIDDDLDKLGIPFVKIDDDSIAKDFGILDELPALVYFEDEIPSVYEGDLHNEEKALKWIVKQAQEDTIEEVTEEMLNYLVKGREYVLVFYGEYLADGEMTEKQIRVRDDVGHFRRFGVT